MPGSGQSIMDGAAAGGGGAMPVSPVSQPMMGAQPRVMGNFNILGDISTQPPPSFGFGHQDPDAPPLPPVDGEPGPPGEKIDVTPPSLFDAPQWDNAPYYYNDPYSDWGY